MGQSYKVFKDEKAVWFTPDINILFPGDSIILKYDGTASIGIVKTLLDEPDNQSDCLLICQKQVEEAFNHFRSLFTLVKAAGGLVRNLEGSYLLIQRNNRWDLPKGKLEKGETPELAALRETAEETGISELRLIRRLPQTFHIFRKSERDYLKRTYWYEMVCGPDPQLIPQTEEGISQVLFLPREAFVQKMEGSYRSLKNLLAYSGFKIKDY